MVEDYAAKLNALAPISLRSLKRVLNAAPDSSLKVALDIEGHSYEKLRTTEDYMEGIKAFSERRPGVYKGR
jgi:2-oxoglutaroyl-CoA hydrolase